MREMVARWALMLRASGAHRRILPPRRLQLRKCLPLRAHRSVAVLVDDWKLDFVDSQLNLSDYHSSLQGRQVAPFSVVLGARVLLAHSPG